MSLAGGAVGKPQFTVVVFALLVAIGIHSVLTIPRAEDPEVPVPAFLVLAVYPGASPQTLEQLVVDPIEARLDELDDVDTISSAIEDGVSSTVIDFVASADADRKYGDVVREVNALRGELPATIQHLEVQRLEASRAAILQIAIVSDVATYRELRFQAQRLEDRLATIPGVRSVDSWAYPDPQVRVVLDPLRLSQFGVSLEQVERVLDGGSSIVPGGGIDLGPRRFNVVAGNHYESIEQIRDSVVAGGATGAVTIGDLGDVRWGYAEATHLARANGRSAVWVTTTLREGHSIFTVRDHLLREVEDFREEVGADIDLQLVFDQSRNVSRRLGRLLRDFAIAVVLVFLTLLPLGIRASLIVMISVPLSLAIGLSLLHASGFTLNQLTIVGFVIALGLLVDDSIVVTENVIRFLRLGYQRQPAAIEATEQIQVAVLGSTATVILAFLPLLVLPGVPGSFIRGLPAAVLFTVAASLVVSLTIIPFLAAMTMHAHLEGGNRAYRAVRRAIEATYRPLLRVAMRWRRSVVFAAMGFAAASMLLLPRIGFSLFPKAGLPFFRIEVETPHGSSLAETDRAVRFVEEVLGDLPGVSQVSANVGRGNPQIYYNVRPEAEQTNVGEVVVHLRRYEPDRTPALLDSLREELRGYAGARFRILEFQNGPPVDAPIAVRVFADDLDVLQHLASVVEQELTQTQGATYIDNPLRTPRTDLAVQIDSHKAQRLGIDTLEAKNAVRTALAGRIAGRLRNGDGDEFEIRVSLTPDESDPLGSLEYLTLSSSSGVRLPLSQISDLELKASPPRIEHYQGMRSQTVTAHARTGYNTDRITRSLIDRLESLDWPPGSRWQAAGEFESRQESLSGFGAALLVAGFGLLAVLVLEFRNFRNTLVVASVLPLGVGGGLIALCLASYSLSFTAMVGFIALVGIEVKNSILLVDFTDFLRREGVHLDEAIRRAGEARFFPILLTTLTAVGSLLPLALERSELYSLLAVVIMGGLISSTALGRLVTPVLYRMLAPDVKRERSAPGGG